MQRIHNEEEYRRYLYTKDLRKTSNGLGIMLLVIFAMELIASTVMLLIMSGSGVRMTGDAVLELLENGLLSSLLFFVTALIYILVKKRSFGALFPFEKVGAKKLAMLCVIGVAFSLMSNIAPDLLSQVFELFGIQNSGGSFDFGDSKPPVLMYYLTVAVMPAFTEEFAFRGVIMGSLRKYSDGLALVVSSALFALMHGNFVQIPFTFCGGLVFGFIALKANSLLPAIIVHFINNGLSVTFDLLYQYDIMSDAMINAIYGVIIIVLCGLALIFIRRFINEDGSFFTLEGADVGIPFRNKLKTVAGSPTLISFAVIMLLFSVYVIMMPYLM